MKLLYSNWCGKNKMPFLEETLFQAFHEKFAFIYLHLVLCAASEYIFFHDDNLTPLFNESYKICVCDVSESIFISMSFI